MLSRLGEYIDIVNIRNTEEYLDKSDVVGISTQKMFIETKADLTNVSTKNYKIVNCREFAYVSDTSRRGDKISLAFNNLNKKVLVSSISTVFRVINEKVLLPEYLYIYFNRPEFDRIARFNSWGSARETFSWDDLCDLKIEVPEIEIQKKYVEIFNTLSKNQKNIESSLEDLRLASQIGIEKFRDLYPTKEIRNYITEHKTINSDLKVKNVKSLNREMGFLKTTRRINNMDKYKVVNYDDIVYPPPHFGEVGTIGIYKEKYQSLVSPMYVTFSVDKNHLLPDYLFMWFKRKSFMRFAFFLASSSIRDTFDFEMLSEYKIPFPPLEKQQMIVDLFNVYEKRKKMNEELKNTIRDIIPILIKGAIQESKGVI